MGIKHFKISMVVIIGYFALQSQAASVSLVYTGDNAVNDMGELTATQGDILTFDILWDFSDAPTIGGGFDINFNPLALAFESFELAPICNDPDCYGAWSGFLVEEDRIFDWFYGSFLPIDGELNMGSVTFEFLGHDFSQSFLFLGPTTGLGGPFISSDDFVTILDVDYNEVRLAPVPLPAAVWLFFGALGALAGLGAGRTTRPGQE